MRVVQTLAVTMIKSGAQVVINAADFDPGVHRKGAPPRKPPAVRPSVGLKKGGR